MAATATLTATSLEGQSVEIMREIQQAEDAWVAAGLALVPPVTRTRRLNVNPNFINGTISYTLTVPVAITDAPDGYTLGVITYLP
jgi:hypothetical protein